MPGVPSARLGCNRHEAHAASPAGGPPSDVSSSGGESVDVTEASQSDRKPSCFFKLTQKKEALLDHIQNGFMRLGGCIFDHAIWFLSAALVVTAVCSLSFLFINFETRADLLYALPASRARSDMAKLTSLYGNFPRINMVFVVSANNDTVLSAPILRKLKHLDEYIKYSLRNPATEFHEAMTFQDVCYRMRLPDVDMSAVDPSGSAKHDAPECYTSSALDLYRNEQQYGQPLATRNWPYIPNVAGNKIVKADLTLTDPHVHKLPSGTTRLFNATGFLMLYNTDSSDAESLSKSLLWETTLIDFINNDVKRFAAKFDLNLHTATGLRNSGGTAPPSRNLSPEDREGMSSAYSDKDWEDFLVFVNAQRSWQDELGRSTAFDWRLIRDYIIAYIIIATYMVVTCHTRDMIKSKSICGFVGSLSALFGFAAGGGICYWLGLRHTPTMHASPFLVLAIGLDNTFVVLNFYSLAHIYNKQPRLRCQMALRDAGLSITITTFTSIISFLVGAAGPYLAVRNFCVITAMGLLGGYVMNIVFFFPTLCLEARSEARDQVFVLGPLAKLLTRGKMTLPFPQPIVKAVGVINLELPVVVPSGVATDGAPTSLSTTHHTEVLPKRSATPPTSPPPQGYGKPGHPLPPPEGPDDWDHPSGESDLSQDSLTNRLSGGRSIHEIVAIQWRLVKRDKELTKELAQRQLPAARGSWSAVARLRALLSPDERRALNNAEVTVLDSPPQLLSPNLLCLSAEIVRLAQVATDEGQHIMGGRSRKVFFRILGPLMSIRRVQALLLCGSLVYFSWAMYGTVTRLRSGLDLENLTPPDSYLREAFTLSHDKFPIFPYETNLYFTAPTLSGDSNAMKRYLANDYGTRRTRQAKIEDPKSDDQSSVRSSHEMDGYMNALGEVAWWEPNTMEALIDLDHHMRNMSATQDILNGLLLFYNENAPKIFVPGTTSEERRLKFHQLLFKWLQSGVVGRHVRDEFRYENPHPDDPQGLPRLLAYRAIVFNYNFLNSFAQSQYMVEVRDLCDRQSENWRKLAADGRSGEGPDPVPPPPQSSGFTAIPFMETFLFFESDVTIFRATCINMATAFVAIVLASCLLMKGFSTAVLVTLMICSVDVGIFGAMGFWGIHLNILSMILLVLSIGFSIDYTVHVVHTFTHCLGRTRSDKVVETLILMANPVTHGAISTLLGISPVGFRREFILETFFRMTLLVIAFGFLNGVIFLPAALAIAGPVFRNTKQESRKLESHLQSTVQPLATFPIIKNK